MDFIRFKKSLFKLDLESAEKVLTLRNKNIQLAFNMNGCFGNIKEIFYGIGNKKITEFLYTNHFEAYCFKTDKECIAYFESFKNAGIDINIHIGSEEILIKKRIKRLSKTGKQKKDKIVEVFNPIIEGFLNMPNIDLTIMNPPYSFKENNNLDMNIINECIDKLKEIIIIMPNKLYYKFQSVNDFYDNKNLKEQQLKKVDEVFENLSTVWEYISFYHIKNDGEFNKNFNVLYNTDIYECNRTYENRCEIWDKIKYGKKLINVIEKFKPLYNELMSKYKSMVHDCKNFIYEENKQGLHGIKKSQQTKLSRVKNYLKSGKYKFCLYKGCGNHEYDELKEYEGDLSIFNGQICWLTNNKNVYENMKYWINSPLFDLWRKFYLKGCKYAACWNYINVPAVNFNMKTTEFIDYINSLNSFSKSDIKILKDFNVHNVNTLKVVK